MDKKTVLITGASEGIGLAVAKEFARKGYRLVLVARNLEKLENAIEPLQMIADIITISKDLSKENAAKELYEFLIEQNIQINILVNNAGIGLEGNFNELPLSKQLQMLQLNLITLTELTYYWIPHMIERRFGRIINLSSIAGPLPTPEMAVYGATKAYVLNFSQALHIELRTKGDFVVTTVCPGPTKTNFNKKSTMKKLDKVLEKTGVSPESVANAIINGVEKRKTLIIPNFKYKLLLGLGKILPISSIPKIMGKLMN